MPQETTIVAWRESGHSLADGNGKQVLKSMSLRERQRLKRQASVLASAGELFRSRGFAKTTMESIAEDAEVGIATVYNYFGTKEAILAELFRPSLDRSFAEAQTIIASPPVEPPHGVIAILRCYRHLQEEWNDRSLLRTFASFGLGSSGVIRDLIVETDQKLRQQLDTLLKLYADKGSVPKNLNLDNATRIIFSLFNQFYYQFLQSDDVAYAEVITELEILIPTLFQPWERNGDP